MKTLVRSDRGSNTVEYALLSAVVAAMMVGLLAFGETAGVLLSGLTDAISHPQTDTSLGGGNELPSP